VEQTAKYTSESSIGCLLEKRARRRCYPTTLLRRPVTISVPLSHCPVGLVPTSFSGVTYSGTLTATTS
jgi:hypothetical protein